MLTHCDNPEIYDTLAAEIIESVTTLSSDQFGNYVVQYLLEHGGQARRSLMVKRFAGNLVGMCYKKHASNVIEACLVFGSYEDRQLIIDEIIVGAGGGHWEHIMVSDLTCATIMQFPGKCDAIYRN